MRLLVTGGCGFVGSNFLRYVLQHYGPEMITNLDSLVSGHLSSVEGLAAEFGERYAFLQADVCDGERIEAVLSEHQFFGIVNFASESASGSTGMEGLVDRARKHGVRRFLQVSSHRTMRGDAAAARNQAAADAVAMANYRVYGEEVVMTRSPRNYGPLQSLKGFIPRTIIGALRDEPVAVAGDGLAARGWLHVEDHCSAIFCALLAGEAGTIYQLTAEQTYSELEVAQRILDQLGKPRELIRHTPGEAEPDGEIEEGASLAHEKLDWTPRKHFADALRETVEWYVRNREWWEPLLRG